MMLVDDEKFFVVETHFNSSATVQKDDDDDELSRATNKVQICMNNGSCPGLKLRYILSLDLETGRKLAQQLKWTRKVFIIFFG